MIKIVQCWDDGVEDDIRLCEILRAAGARATFNLNPGLHGPSRGHPWRHKDIKDVRRLSRSELVDVYQNFTIANHTRTHPWARRIPLKHWRHEVVDARKELQDIFGQPISGFVYPFGDYDDATVGVVREAGHIYARICTNATPCLPVQDPVKFASDCHHAVPDFWERYERAKNLGAPAFYFWGHSYEFVTEDDWQAYSAKLDRFNKDADAVWADLPELFQ